MPVATVARIFCIRPGRADAAGGVTTAILPELIIPADDGATIDLIRRVAETVPAAEHALAAPDTLYLTAGRDGGREHVVWPGSGDPVTMWAGRSVSPELTLCFDDSHNLSLWGHCPAAGHDLLGSVRMFASERGQGELAKLARPRAEQGYYYVVYRVD